MKKYFLQFKTNQAKNKAQEELQTLVSTFENTLCDDCGLQRIIDSLIEKCNALNVKYPRCKPIVVHYYPKGESLLNKHELYACTPAPDYNDVFYCNISEVEREEFENYNCLTNETITLDIPAQDT